MVKDTLSTLLFVLGYGLVAPSLPWAMWAYGPQTSESLVLLLLSLPLYVWACSYAYLRSFNAAEAGILWAAPRVTAWLEEKSWQPAVGAKLARQEARK